MENDLRNPNLRSKIQISDCKWVKFDVFYRPTANTLDVEVGYNRLWSQILVGKTYVMPFGVHFENLTKKVDFSKIWGGFGSIFGPNRPKLTHPHAKFFLSRNLEKEIIYQ